MQATSWQTIMPFPTWPCRYRCKSISIAASHAIPAEHHPPLTSSFPSHFPKASTYLQHQSNHASQSFQSFQRSQSYQQERPNTSPGKGRYKQFRHLHNSFQIRQRCTSSPPAPTNQYHRFQANTSTFRDLLQPRNNPQSPLSPLSAIERSLLQSQKTKKSLSKPVSVLLRQG
jgi:hypothetical protein